MLRRLLFAAVLLLAPLQALAAHKIIYNVRETTTTSGTGTINLAGAEDSYLGFASQLSTGDTTVYAIYASSGTAVYEIGIGTFTDASPDTLARTTILYSTNGGSPLNLPGTSVVVEGTNIGRGLQVYLSGSVIEAIAESLNYSSDFNPLACVAAGNPSGCLGPLDTLMSLNSSIVTRAGATVGDAGGELDADVVKDTLGTWTLASGTIAGVTITTGSSSSSCSRAGRWLLFGFDAVTSSGTATPMTFTLPNCDGGTQETVPASQQQRPLATCWYTVSSTPTIAYLKMTDATTVGIVTGAQAAINGSNVTRISCEARVRPTWNP